uniref:Uncharacterized protein n=1 Tax=Aegilops tauschii subsp. strangulata TaxID=200361 RepID=A0A452XJ99_AEGTS
MANASEPPEESGDAGEVLGYVKVMTNDPMEALQKQISIYATICEQLVEMHRAFTEHQDSIAGMYTCEYFLFSNPNNLITRIQFAYLGHQPRCSCKSSRAFLTKEMEYQASRR